MDFVKFDIQKNKLKNKVGQNKKNKNNNPNLNIDIGGSQAWENF